MQALDNFKRFAVGPEVIADVVFNSAGRFVIRDQGVITVVLRVITKVRRWLAVACPFPHVS